MDLPALPARSDAPTAGEDALASAAQLRDGLGRLRRDVAASLRLCGRDFGVLGGQLVAALHSRDRREQALKLALEDEQRGRERLAASLAELRGNLRVLCRVRPPLALEDTGDSSPSGPAVVATETDVTVLTTTRAAKRFAFPRVFDGAAASPQLFAEVAPLVQAAADGHHACVFAYGQTGAGKSHTLAGGIDAQDEDQYGIYARAASLLFEVAAERAQVSDWRVALQMVEVYNDEIYDLLGDRVSVLHDPTGSAASSPSTPVSNGIHAGATGLMGPSQLAASSSPPVGEIRHGDRGIFLKNVATVTVTTAAQVTAAIARGASTTDRANRAHSVVLLHVTSVSKFDGSKRAGRLALVDLAGSERLAKTDSFATSAAAQREAQHINKSLAAVGDVMAAVLAREKHVPYRNSKLTHLLQDSLGGPNNHALLLVHVSPARADAAETINSLKFAARVSRTPSSGRDQRAEISKLHGVISSQAAQLQAMQDKLAAEVELRKKFEKRLEDYRQEELRRKTREDDAGVKTTSPPDQRLLGGRRWSLYTRRESLGMKTRAANGIENIAENILRSEESPINGDVSFAEDLPTGLPTSLATPKRRTRRHSLSTTDKRQSPSVSVSASSIRRTGTKRHHPEPQVEVRSILKKQRDNDGQPVAPKQVSFDLSVRASPLAAPQLAGRQPIAPLRAPASARRIPTGASRVLAPATTSGVQGSPARRIASATPIRQKPKWNAGWR